MARLVVAAALLFGLWSPSADAATLRVGSLTLRSCDSAWCGSISRPLGNGHRIRVAFRWYAPTSASGPPLVAVEGGPGYPSTGSRVEYRGIFKPLIASRGLLLMDQRGTGGSALIDCKRVQGFTGRTSGPAFALRVGECATAIDAQYGAGAHSYFATAYAVDDLAALLRALRFEAVDLYGDSYGTFFVQEFMARHPSVLHSVVLDSAYPRRGLDPWYASSGAAARVALETVSPGSVLRLGVLLDRVRRAPIVGRTRDADDASLSVRVGTRELADMVQDSGSDPVILRELDASVRAALAGDDVPLLRLAGQSGSWNHSPSDAAYFSRGAYLAVSCLDYPVVPDLLKPPDAFAPFTGAEWRTISGFSQPYDICTDWPVSVKPPPLPDVRLPASVPILILGGDLDSLTPLSDASAFGPALGENVQLVTLKNTVHVTSEGDNYLVAGMRCARQVIRSFVRGAPDEACAASIPALHTADYPRRLADAVPATLVSGPDPGEPARRAATVAAQAFADATIRRVYSGGANRGPGLRRGAFTAKGTTIDLNGLAFVDDATVAGKGTFAPATGAVDATLTIAGVTVHLAWTQATPVATATIGASVLSLPAP